MQYSSIRNMKNNMWNWVITQIKFMEENLILLKSTYYFVTKIYTYLLEIKKYLMVKLNIYINSKNLCRLKNKEYPRNTNYNGTV